MLKSKEMRAVILFTLLCFLFSWPFFFCVDAWLGPLFEAQGNASAVRFSVLFGHLLGMLGPAVAALIMGRFYHKQSPPPWKWSKPKYYIWVALAMLAFWALPGLIGLFFGDKITSPIETYVWVYIAAAVAFGWISGMGEETGWCAYVLPTLSPAAGKTRSLVVSGVIRGLWHWPVVIGPVIVQVIHGEHTWLELIGAGIVIAVQLVFSNIFFGAIFGWIWYETESIPLVGWLHYWHNLVRDVMFILLVSYAGGLWASQISSIIWLTVGVMGLATILQGEGMTWREFFGGKKSPGPQKPA